MDRLDLLAVQGTLKSLLQLHSSKASIQYALIHTVKGFGFSSGNTWMWELDYKESWAPNYALKLCYWGRLLRVNQEIQPVHPRGKQSWIFIGRTDAKAETPIFWPPVVRTDSLEKTLMLGKIEGRKTRGHRGGDGWMSSPTWWIWVWPNSWSWWRSGKSDILQSME